MYSLPLTFILYSFFFFPMQNPFLKKPNSPSQAFLELPLVVPIEGYKVREWRSKYKVYDIRND